MPRSELCVGGIIRYACVTSLIAKPDHAENLHLSAAHLSAALQRQGELIGKEILVARQRRRLYLDLSAIPVCLQANCKQGRQVFVLHCSIRSSNSHFRPGAFLTGKIAASD